MKLKVDPITLPCLYCGAKAGEACIVTLAPEVGPLSVRWQHGAREKAATE